MCFFWTDSDDVYDGADQASYLLVKAEFLTFGHQIHGYDKRADQELGSIHEQLVIYAGL